jgi:two-component sensor histidine kinase/CHASE3 domain sensor protein
MQDLHEISPRHQRALVATIALSFVLLLGSAVLVWKLSRSADEADHLVLHTLDVKRRIAEINTVLTRAESSQRGYLITVNRAVLEPYSEARVAIPGLIGALRKQVADNPPQVTRVDELAALIERRFASIEAAFASIRTGAPADVAAIVSERGEPLMKEFRTQIDALDRVEDALLVERQQAVAAKRERFFQAMAGMLIACGVLALFALVSVRRYLATLRTSRAVLSDQNRLLEERVRERTFELERAADVAERERRRAESLLTDVNHRVGNNLALVSSFLTMQLRAVRHPEAMKALDAARARVQAIASAHRKLRLGADFATVRANEVLGAVIDDISAGLPPGDQIKIQYDVAPLEINARDAVSLGVLTSELVMNAVKHAFGAGETGLVNVKFARNGTATPFIEVADNGVGMNEKQTSETERSETGSLGGRIIDMVARQFGGRPERAPCNDDQRRPGTRIRIELSKLQLVAPAS